MVREQESEILVEVAYMFLYTHFNVSNSLTVSFIFLHFNRDNILFKF